MELLLHKKRMKEFKDLRGTFLRWLLPFIFILLIFELFVIAKTNTYNDNKQVSYFYLLSALLVACGIGFFFTMKHRYTPASYVAMFMVIIGTWGSVLIEFVFQSLDYFPLIFVSFTVVFASILLPLLFTILLSIIQLLGVHLLLMLATSFTPDLKASFISFILVISVLSIIMSFIHSEHIRRLKESSIKDHLTGLFNRRYFDETLDYWIERARSKNNSFGVILIDVDNFKSYNDNHGHASGDKLLQSVSTFLVNKVGIHDIVCRYGGDEFAIIVTDSTREYVYTVAKQLHQLIKEVDFSTLGHSFDRVTLSMGLSFFPGNGDSRKEFMEYADYNLLSAKHLGKDQIVG